MQEHPSNQPLEESDSHDSPESEMSEEILDAELVENPCTNQPPDSPFIGFYRPPRLTIAYLLIWITLSAVLMKMTMYLISEFEYPSTSPEWSTTFHKVIWYISSGISAAGLLGVLVIVTGKLRGASGRLQPGHWLLLILAASWFLQTGITTARLLFPDPLSQESLYTTILWYLYAGMYLTLAIGYLLLTILPRGLKQWRFLMATQTIISLTRAAYFFSIVLKTFGIIVFLQGASTLLNVICLLVLIAVAVIDLILKRRRDGLHWLGAAQLGWGAVTYLTLIVIWKIARP